MQCIISGYGYVGKATGLITLDNFSHDNSVDINDPYLNMTATTWDIADYHFVCVPTPLNEHNTHSLTAVADAIAVAAQHGFKGVTVIRSTMSPLDYDSLNLDAEQTIVWPEFLRKSSWAQDATMPLMSIVGGKNVEQFVSDYGKFPITHIGDAKSACMAKLSINSYLAVRTVITHDIRKTCDALNLNWGSVKHVLELDPRLGCGYWEQPGPDGEWGFGGGCLPKDTAAMSTLMNTLGIAQTYAAWAVDKNKTIRNIS
jgi:UDPglucose 6-dehydrogenase